MESTQTDYEAQVQKLRSPAEGSVLLGVQEYTNFSKLLDPRPKDSLSKQALRDYSDTVQYRTIVGHSKTLMDGLPGTISGNNTFRLLNAEIAALLRGHSVSPTVSSTSLPDVISSNVSEGLVTIRVLIKLDFKPKDLDYAMQKLKRLYAYVCKLQRVIWRNKIDAELALTLQLNIGSSGTLNLIAKLEVGQIANWIVRYVSDTLPEEIVYVKGKVTIFKVNGIRHCTSTAIENFTGLKVYDLPGEVLDCLYSRKVQATSLSKARGDISRVHQEGTFELFSPIRNLLFQEEGGDIFEAERQVTSNLPLNHPLVMSDPWKESRVIERNMSAASHNLVLQQGTRQPLLSLYSEEYFRILQTLSVFGETSSENSILFSTASEPT
jgi:hypothetical protein